MCKGEVTVTGESKPSEEVIQTQCGDPQCWSEGLWECQERGDGLKTGC